MRTSRNILRYLAGVSGHEAPSYVLASPEVGGLRFGSRLHELRHRGLQISYRYKEVNGKKTKTTIYRLDTPLEFIDFDNCSVKI